MNHWQNYEVVFKRVTNGGDDVSNYPHAQYITAEFYGGLMESAIAKARKLFGLADSDWVVVSLSSGTKP